MAGVFTGRGKCGDRDVSRAGCIKMEAQTGVTQPRAEELVRIAGSCQKLGRRKGGFFPSAVGGSMVLPTPWFQTSGLVNCERINLSFYATQFVVTVLQQP